MVDDQNAAALERHVRPWVSSTLKADTGQFHAKSLRTMLNQ